MGLMDDEAQHLGRERGGGLYCRSFSLSQTLSGSCEMLHLSGGTQPNTGSAAKWSCKGDVRKHRHGIKKDVTYETKDKEKPWKQRNIRINKRKKMRNKYVGIF